MFFFGKSYAHNIFNKKTEMRALCSKMKNRHFWKKSGAGFAFWTFYKCPFSKSAARLLRIFAFFYIY